MSCDSQLRVLCLIISSGIGRKSRRHALVNLWNLSSSQVGVQRLLLARLGKVWEQNRALCQKDATLFWFSIRVSWGWINNSISFSAWLNSVYRSPRVLQPDRAYFSENGAINKPFQSGFNSSFLYLIHSWYIGTGYEDFCKIIKTFLTGNR